MTSPVTPGSSPSSKTTPVRRPLQRNSSQSSIDSTASDSQLLLRSNKDGRLRRLSNSSIRSTQSDRTDLQPRGNTQARHDICRIDLTNTPRSPGSIHELPVSKNSPVKEKTSNEVVWWNTLIVYIILACLHHFENQIQVLGLVFRVWSLYRITWLFSEWHRICFVLWIFEWSSPVSIASPVVFYFEKWWREQIRKQISRFKCNI